MLRKLFILAFLFGLLAGCTFQGNSPVPTPYPANYLPTVIYLTAQSIHSTAIAQTASAVTLTPTLTPSLTPSPILPTPTASTVPTPLPGMQTGAIQIISPGPDSKVVSPLEARLSVVSQKDSKVYIALYGEDGSLLYDELINLPNTSSGQYVFAKFPFEIRAAGEIGYLQVTTRDNNGVLMALNTVRVLLLSNGVSQITPPGNTIYERVALETPSYKAVVSGGVLQIKGTYLPFNLQQVVLELVDVYGRSLNASRIVNVTSLDTQVIDKTLPYKVDASTPAYLVIHQSHDVLKNPVFFSHQYPIPWNGPAYVYSELITLNP
jgi:hypothetical protein